MRSRIECQNCEMFTWLKSWLSFRKTVNPEKCFSRSRSCLWLEKNIRTDKKISLRCFAKPVRNREENRMKWKPKIFYLLTPTKRKIQRNINVANENEREKSKNRKMMSAMIISQVKSDYEAENFEWTSLAIKGLAKKRKWWNAMESRM